ncbi:MAG: ATP-grasp domain-containing protein [Anaeroplasma sp.]
MKIGILFGGNSLEHEISIITAFQLKNKLKSIYDVVMLYIDFDSKIFDVSTTTLNDFKNNKIKARIISMEKVKNKIDCIIIATHGENGEDGIAAALCEFYNIPYVGCNVLAASLCMNKWKTYQLLSRNGITMLETKHYTFNDFLNGIDLNDFPVIIKPIYGGSSIGISVCNKKEELDDCLIEAFKYNDEIIVQKYYKNLEEYNLAIYEGGVSELEKITNKNDIFSFDNKYNESFKQFHQKLIDEKEEFVNISKEIYKILGLSGLIRIDFFKINNEIIVNEINTTPGALAMYLFPNFEYVIKDLVNLALTKKKKRYSRGNFLKNCEINK